MFHLTAYLGSETRDPTAGNTQWLDEQLSRVALGADRSPKKRRTGWITVIVELLLPAAAIIADQ
jgi:hypothetical protein